MMLITSSLQVTRPKVNAIEIVRHARRSFPSHQTGPPLTERGRKRSPDQPIALVADITTLRRHMESNHKVRVIFSVMGTPQKATADTDMIGNVSTMGRKE
jgi:hypothetical protein